MLLPLPLTQTQSPLFTSFFVLELPIHLPFKFFSIFSTDEMNQNVLGILRSYHPLNKSLPRSTLPLQHTRFLRI